MSDFDDQARAAGERARRRADEIAASVDPTARMTSVSTARPAGRARVLTAAAAVLVVAAGVAGLVAVTSSDPADVTDGDTVPATSDVPAPPTTAAPSTAVPPTTVPSITVPSITVPPTSAAPSTTERVPAAITRPIIDPELCTPIAALDNERTGLPRDPGSGLPVTLFATRSEVPVPIQAIGDPLVGPSKPFALVLRYFELTARRGVEATTEINGVPTFVRDWGNRNGEAEWTLPDGSIGYLRSRDLTEAQIVAIVERLTPRPADADVNGFDYDDAGAPPGLELVAERMNTEPWGGGVAGSQCVVESTGYAYRLTSYTGDPTLMFAAVIDTHVPLEVASNGSTVMILSGPDDPTAPSLGTVVQADLDVWERLLDLPGTNYASSMVVRVGDDVEVPFVPIGDPSTPTGSLTLRIAESEGVAFLEVYTSGAVIAEASEYWKVEIDERVRGRSTAVPGPGQGVAGTRLGDAPITEPFFVRVSTTDGDDQEIQTTGLVQLVPAP